MGGTLQATILGSCEMNDERNDGWSEVCRCLGLQGEEDFVKVLLLEEAFLPSFINNDAFTS